MRWRGIRQEDYSFIGVDRVYVSVVLAGCKGLFVIASLDILVLHVYWMLLYSQYHYYY